MNIVDNNFWKVDIQYLQMSQLLVAAPTEEAAKEMVTANVLEGTEGFQINSVTPLSDAEKQHLLNKLQNPDASEEDLPAETRTIN